MCIRERTRQIYIDIHHLVKDLSTAQKAVTNVILKAGINNNVNVCRYIFMDNRYASPQLLAMMTIT